MNHYIVKALTDLVTSGHLTQHEVSAHICPESLSAILNKLNGVEIPIISGPTAEGETSSLHYYVFDSLAYGRTIAAIFTLKAPTATPPPLPEVTATETSSGA